MRALRASRKTRLLISCAVCLAVFHAAGAGRAHETITPVVIDTDAALDDLRATALLLMDGRTKVVAVVVSDGACSPAAGAANVRSALAFLGRGEIPVAAGRTLAGAPPPWREMSEAMGWSDIPRARGGAPSGAAAETIVRALSNAEGKVAYLCLGPMTNLADALRAEPSIRGKIAAVYYYGAPPGVGSASWNTDRDRAAATEVASSDVPLYCCALPDSCLVRFDTNLYLSLAGLETRGTEFLGRLHADARVQSLLREGHFVAWDETAALSLMNPEVVDWEPVPGNGRVFEAIRFDSRKARSAYLRAAGRGGPGEADGSNGAAERDVQVFRYFPVDPALMREDVAAIAGALIERHGLEEWRSAVITNELHGHLGVYSILGVKMGIRAREILNAELDDLVVVSGASLEPPLSCLNDGLQASTGATLGRGTISIDAAAKAPAATFVQGARRVKLVLKDSVASRIRADIRRAIAEYGDLTPEYFDEVRRLSLAYWLELDRGDIFVETTEEGAD